MLTIGPHAIDSRVVLAPMAGVTDLPFRNLCSHWGAGLTTSEMLTSDIALWSSSKSRLRLVQNGNKKLNCIQIAGSEPHKMAEAAKLASELGADIIDINMGCPAKKVCKKLAGSALLKDEKLVQQILSAVVKSVQIPVTLKTRTGWAPDVKNGVQIAKIAEGSGIQALTIHGRTRECRFNGEAEYETIAQIVKTVNIPVIANGDIDSAEKALTVLMQTGAAAVMVGRAAFGNPWIFNKISRGLKEKNTFVEPTKTTILATMESHLDALYSFYGEFKGSRIARKHFAWYCRTHFSKASNAINEFNSLENPKSQLDAVKKLIERPIISEEKVA